MSHAASNKYLHNVNTRVYSASSAALFFPSEQLLSCGSRANSIGGLLVTLTCYVIND